MAPRTCGGSVRPSKETPSGPSRHAATKDRGPARLGRRSNALKNPQPALHRLERGAKRKRTLIRGEDQRPQHATRGMGGKRGVALN